MTNQADAAIAWAKQQIGKPYRWGATGPNSFDCSGLVQAAYGAAGIKLPRTTATMIAVGSRVAQADLAPGDLLFPDPGHVQIYEGGGMVIEAPRTGLNVREVKTWGFWAARRVTEPGTVNATLTDFHIPGPINSLLNPTHIPGFDPNTIINKAANGTLGLNDLVSPLTNIYDQVKSILDVFVEIGKGLIWLTDPKHWIRVAQFVLGVILLHSGIKRLAGG